MSGHVPGWHKGVDMVVTQCGPNVVVNNIVSIFRFPGVVCLYFGFDTAVSGSLRLKRCN
jgi:hypothetical protein